MAGRCRQLCVLLWKNFRIRLKQKKYMAAEIAIPMNCIVIPVIMNLVVGSVTKDTPTTTTMDTRMAECFFSPSPLLSAGFVPFLESAFVLRRECEYRINDTDIGYTIDPGDSRFPQIVDFVKYVLHSKNATEELNRTLKSVVKLTKEFDGGPKNCTVMIEALEEFNRNDIKKGLDALNNLLFDSFENSQITNVAKYTLCRRRNCLAEEYKKILDEPQASPNQNNDICKEETIDKECASKFGHTKTGLYQIDSLSSVTRGYILVTPENDKTKEIVEKMKEWLGGFEWMKEFVLEFYRNADKYQSSFTDSNVSSAIKKLNETCPKLKTKLQLDRLLQLFQRDQSSALLTKLKNDIAPIAAWLKCFSTDRFRFVNSTDDLKNKTQCLQQKNKFFAGLTFNTSGPDIWRYSISMLIRKENETERHLHYFKSGFIFLQDAVDRAIIERSNRAEKLPAIGVYMQQFPRRILPPEPFDFPFKLALFLFGMMLSWLPSVSVLVKNLVYEKEMRLKEFMKMMGLSNFVLWLAWFLQSLIQLAIAVLVITIFAIIGFVQNANFIIIFVFLLLTVVALITEAFLLSTLFSRTSFAAVCSGFIYLALYAPFIAVFVLRYLKKSLKISDSVQLALSLIPQCAFGFGCVAIFSVENGITWEHLAEKSQENLGMIHLGHAMAMLLVDSLINIILAWYIEAVWPGEFGVPHPFCFFLTPSYWFPRVSSSAAVSSEMEIPPDIQPFTETEPTHVKLGVAVRKLRKVFSNGKVAVSNVSVNFYESQITSFLGHNGAGKTTIMSIISGLYPPSNGTVFIHGLDVRKSIDEIRKSMGLCPQHNILFEMLSTRQQLIFYSALKGVPWATAKQHAQTMIDELQMHGFADKPAQDLSGGMKRRLSVASAFIGGSKVVLLDEPTAGVDPSARRQIWDLLLKYKEGRTIILSTHHMDEADVLGDRIAIIGAGQMRCVGSSMFLKKKYASGYRLTVVRMHPPSTPTSSPNLIDFEQARYDFIKSMFPDASIVEDLGQELTYNIPSSDPKKLKNVFVELETKKDAFGISSFGVSETKLEEVFLKAVGNEAGEAPPKSIWEKCCPRQKKRRGTQEASGASKSDQEASGVSKSETSGVSKSDSEGSDIDNRPAVATPSSSASTSMQRLIGPRLCCLQFRALFIKRLKNALRNLKGALMEVFIPLLLVVLIIAMRDVIAAGEEGQEELPQSVGGALNASRFSEAVVFESFDETKFGPHKRYFSDLTKNIKEQIDPIGGTVESLANSSINDWLFASAGKKKRFGGYSLGDPSGAYIEDVDWEAIRNNIAELNGTLDQFMDRVGITKMNDEVSDVTSRRNFSAFLRGVDVKHNIKIWFNYSMAAPIYLNVLNNAILRSIGSNLRIETVDDSFDPNQTSTTTPRPKPSSSQLQLMVHAFLIVLVIFLVFCYVPPSYTMFIIEETRTFSKHLQFVSGAPPILYWVVSFVWDMINYSIIVTGIMIALSAFDIKVFAGTPDTASITFLMLFFFGFAMIPMMYLFTFYFETPSVAFVFLSIVNTFIGYHLSFIVLMVPNKDVQENLRYVFSIFPQFALVSGMFKLVLEGFEGKPNKVTDFAPFFVPMIVSAFIWFGLVQLIEYRHELRRACRKPSLKGAPKPLWSEDDDVRAERALLSDPTNREHYVMKIMNLSKIFKYFCKRDFQAVNNLSVGVRSGECFGLLGVNGAGKTTTFSMLTGKIPITYGDATVCGKSVLMQYDQVRHHIGFCPQFDALHARLSAREELRFYAQIRGVPTRMVDEVVERLIKELGLTVHADRQAGTYSGGNKRKLSTAIAMIGSPELILLDEPTSGMDPKARRGLWNRMKKILKRGDCSIVLTSHSMEECEALCNRIGIMVSGGFRCLGSTQHLKNRYGQGYTLSLKMGTGENIEALKDFMLGRIPDIELKEEHASLVRFKIPPTGTRLSDVFASVVEAMSKFQIDDYTLSQSTLEELFISFATGEHDGPGAKAQQVVVGKKTK